MPRRPSRLAVLGGLAVLWTAVGLATVFALSPGGARRLSSSASCGGRAAPAGYTAAVVLVVPPGRGGRRSLATAQAVLRAQQARPGAASLLSLVVVDDGAAAPLEQEAGWRALAAPTLFVRSEATRGWAAARAAGAEAALGAHPEVSALAFVDGAGAAVRPGWLETLLAAVAADPTVLAAVPAGNLAPGDRPVGGVDASLAFAYAPSGGGGGDGAYFSPAMDGAVFAVAAPWWRKVGGYDTAFSGYARDSGGARAADLELSIRTWACGGGVQLVPEACAAVAEADDRPLVLGLGVAPPDGGAAEDEAAVKARNRERLEDVWFGDPGRGDGDAARRRAALRDAQCRGLDWFAASVARTGLPAGYDPSLATAAAAAAAAVLN